MPTFKFSVLVGEIKAALLFSSDDESRYVLRSVHFDVRPGRLPVMVATDGCRLVVIETDAEQKEEITEAFSLTIDKGFLKPLCAFASSQSSVVTMEYHPSKRVLFYLNDGHCVVDSEQGAVVEANYPNWHQVIPTGDREPISEIGFNAAYLADFTKAAKFIGAESPVIRMNMFSAEGATEIHLSGKPNLYGLVMPIKPMDSPQWQPEFLNMPQPQAA